MRSTSWSSSTGAEGGGPFQGPRRSTPPGNLFDIDAKYGDVVRTDAVAAMHGVDDAFDATPVGSLHEFSGFPEVVEWEERYLPPEDREKYEGSWATR